MSIVCGTDFSQASAPGVAAAAAIASRLGEDEVWLVHVLDPAAKLLDAQAYELLRVAADKRLGAEAAAVRERTHAHAYHQVLQGAAPQTLAAFAEARHARLLILSSQGHGASRSGRLGGTTEAVAETASLPVLVVRDAGPFEAWARGERPLRVLLAIDWTASAEPAIRWVKALRRAAPCDVVVGYVYRSGLGGDGARYGIRLGRRADQPEPEVEELLARDLRARVGELPGAGGLVIRPTLGKGRTREHLLELAEAERADLIVVGRHHRRGRRRRQSITHVLLHDARASVASISAAPGEAALAADDLPRFRRILVATDLSAASNRAIPYACALLGEHGGELVALHVLPGDDRGGEDDAEAIARLRALVPGIALAEGVVARTEVVHDVDAAAAICEAAERVGADAICVGSQGRTGAERMVLGSVAEAVMRRSRRPVLVVRAPAP